MKAKILISVSVLLLIASLFAGTKLQACYKFGWDSCEFDPPLRCIPDVRAFEMYGSSLSNCDCVSGSLYVSCDEVESEYLWCMGWYDCNDACTSCEFNEGSSFHNILCLID